MKINDVRRDNLRALRKEYGPGKLSVMLGYPQPSFLSQLIGPNPSRQVSEKIARRYEKILGLKPCDLDKPLLLRNAPVAVEAAPKSSKISADNAELLIEIIRSVINAVKSENTNLTVEQFAKLLEIAVEDASEHDKIRQSYIKRILEMIK